MRQVRRGGAGRAASRLAGVALAAVVAVAVGGTALPSTGPGENGRIVFMRNQDLGPSKLWTMEPDGSDRQQLTSGPGNDQLPRWSPDGTKVVFQSDRTGEWQVYVRDVASGTETPVTDDSFDNTFPSWSPDGNWIYFLSARVTPARDIYRIAVDGSGETQVTATPAADEGRPSVSPDGSRLLYEVANDVYVADPDGANPVNLTPDTPSIDSYASWSPDGTQIVFVSSRWSVASNEIDVATMDADGANATQLTHAQAPGGYRYWDSDPSWSPEGDSITFVSNRVDGYEFDVFTMPKSGENGTAVNLTDTTGGVMEQFPDWQPVVTPPTNDDWADAEALPGDTAGFAFGSNENATVETGEPLDLGHDGGPTGSTIWWEWTAPSGGDYRFETYGSADQDGSELDTVLGVFTGATVDALSEVAADDDGSNGHASGAAFHATAGTTYWIQVGSYRGYAGGEVVLSWSDTPASDDFVDVHVLDAPGDSGSLQELNVGATRESGEPGAVEVGSTVWFGWIATSSSRQRFSLDPGFDGSLAVYTGCCSFGSLTQVAEAHGPSPVVAFDPQPFNYYVIQVGTYADDPGLFRLSWRPHEAPSNDEWASAESLPATASGSVDGVSNMGAGVERGEWDYISARLHTLWWRWVAPQDGTYVFDTAGSTFDTTVGVFGVPAGLRDDQLKVNRLDELASGNDAVGGGLTSRAAFRAVAGRTYWIQVGTYFGAAGAIDLAWQPSTLENDNFADAAVMDADAGSAAGTTVDGTVEPAEPNPSDDQIFGQSVWYAWTPTASGSASVVADSRFPAGSNFYGSLAVYTGSALTTLAEVGSDYDDSRLTVDFAATAGTTYYVQMGTYGDEPGTFTLAWSLGGPVPANDALAGAIALPGAASGSATGSNVGATTEPGEPHFLGLGDVQTGKTVWWTWVAPSSGTYGFTTAGSDFDTVIGVFTGSGVAGLTEVASDNDGGSGFGGTSRVHFHAEAGTAYSIQVGSFDAGDPGDIQLGWQPGPPNDAFADAELLDDVGGSVDGTTVGATLEATEPLPAGLVENTVWYEWTPATSGTARVQIDGSFRAAIAVYSGSALGSLQQVAADWGVQAFEVTAEVTAGTTYWIQVGARDDPPGTFTLDWSIEGAPPANDDFADADALAGDQGSLGATNAFATFEAGEPALGSPGQAGHTVWYAWTPSANGDATVTFDAGFRGTLAVYEGGTLASLQVLAGGFDGESVEAPFAVAAGTTYRIQVGTYNASPGPFVLAWSLEPGGPPNDDWADAIALPGNVSGSTSGANDGATVEAGEPTSLAGGTIPIGKTVWWSWTAPSSGGFTFYTNGSGFDTVLGVHTGSAVTALTEIAADDDGGTGEWSLLTFHADAGTTYHLQVGSLGAGGPGPVLLGWFGGPPNDDFANADAIAGSSDSIGGSTEGATLEPGEPPLDFLDATVWYRWTAPSSGPAVLSLDAGFGAELSVYTGSGLGALTPVGQDYDSTTPSVAFTAEAGTSYRIRVGTYDDAPGGFTLAWDYDAPMTWVVTTTADTSNDANCQSGSCTLRQAVNAANLGNGEDTVVVPAGTYQLAAGFGALVVSNGVTITGAGARATSILGPPSANRSTQGDRVLDVTAAAGPVVVESVTLSGGTATPSNGFFGGNVRSAGDLTLRDVAVVNGSAYSGGGLANAGGTMLVERTTVSGNQAIFGGGDSGGILNFGDGSNHGALTVENSTVTSNTARLGAGVFSWGDLANTVTIRSSTIAFNAATDRGVGGIGGDGTFTLGSTIVANNTFGGAPSDCSGSISSLGNNLASSADCAFTAAGDLQNTDPQLGPLADNGGPTDTRAPSATSPAVDAGSTSCPPPATDQRGVARPRGGACDIGAVEIDAGPANDDLADAQTVTGASGDAGGTTTLATLEPGEPADIAVGGSPRPGSNSVWYRWQPPRSGEATVQVSGHGTLAFSLVQVYSGPATGPTFGALTPVGSHSSTAALTAPVVAGQTYYVQVMADVLAGGDAGFGFTLSWLLPPANDAFASAAGIAGADGSVGGTTVGATLEAGEPEPFVDLGRTVWYAWTAPATGESTFTVDASFPAAFEVYRGSGLATLSGLAGASVPPLADGVEVEAGITYYVQVGSLGAGGTFTLGWSFARAIDGRVLAANGQGAPGVPVRACIVSCLETTTNADGTFVFADVAAGPYVVTARPADPSLLAAQADADTSAGSVVGLLLRLATSGATSAAAGPQTFRATGCQGGSLHWVATADGRSLGTGDVADGAGGTPVDGVYTIDLAALDAGHPAVLRIDVTITCAGQDPQQETAVLYTDPSGTVVDDSSGAPLAGATVTILDANGAAIPSGDPRLSSATSANPQTSDARGAWGWDVAPGTYRVRAEKTDCGVTTSGNLVVTAGNPVTGVVLHLACTAPAEVPVPPEFPPTTPPTTPTTPTTPAQPALPDPVAGVSFNVLPISGTVLVNGAPLPVGAQIPFGATIDTTNGIASVTTIGPGGQPQTAYFYGGVFQLLQGPDGFTELVMRQGDFSVCKAVNGSGKGAKKKSSVPRRKQAAWQKEPKGAKASKATKAAKESKKVVRQLWGTGKGSFRTKGRFASATVRGTLWLVADRCDGTYTQVNEGLVTVLDLVRGRTITVRTGRSVLVRPR